MIHLYKLTDFRFIKGLILSFLILTSFSLFASDSKVETHGEEEKEYNAGEAIIEHIVDAYSWHIWDYKGHSVAIPLPVILIDEGEFYFFSSAKFDHGHASYKGFEIAHDGPKKGKIIKVNHDTHAEQVAPLDFSITKNVTAVLISLLLICIIFISVAKSYKKRAGKAPKGLQSMMEPLILFIRDDIAKASIGKNYEKYVPFLLTIFFFIFINNLMGLIPFFPGGANVTGSISVTLVLALFTFVITTFSANKNYWMHIVNTPGVPWWLKFPVPLMPIVELIGVFTKPFVLMVRLFANITAGHIIVLGFISLIFIFGNMSTALGYGVSIFSVVFAVFMGLLELLVAFIQAYVFTLLSALYFGMATEEHH